MELSSGKRRKLRVIKGSVAGDSDKYSFTIPLDSRITVGITSFFSGVEGVSTSIMLKLPSIPGVFECLCLTEGSYATELAV